jgi:hypothetical protein
MLTYCPEVTLWGFALVVERRSDCGLWVTASPEIVKPRNDIVVRRLV